MTSLREAFIDSVDVSEEEAIKRVWELPLNDDEKRTIRARARNAADRMIEEAEELWARMGNQLTTDARIALLRSYEHAAELRAMANALEPKD